MAFNRLRARCRRKLAREVRRSELISIPLALRPKKRVSRQRHLMNGSSFDATRLKRIRGGLRELRRRKRAGIFTGACGGQK